MLSGVGIVCFAASYAVALTLEVSRLLFRSGIRGAVMLGFAGAGLLAHTAFLYEQCYRAVHGNGSPLSSPRDWFFVAAWILVLVYLYLVYYHPRQAFGLFLLPLVFGLIAVAMFASEEPFARSTASRAWWGIVHNTSILLGTVSVLVGFVSGLMYLGQARRLKLKLPPIRGLRLPSLEWLERTNGRAIVVSVLSLGVGVASGAVLNLIKQHTENARVPWHDPVVLSMLLTFGWLVLAVGVGVFYRPARQGRKVAYLTLVSFLFLAIALAVGLMFETRHEAGSQGPPEGTALSVEARTRPVGTCPAAARRRLLEQHSPPLINYRSSVIGHWSLVICHSSLVICHSSLVIRHSSFATHQSLFIPRRSAFLPPPAPGGRA